MGQIIAINMPNASTQLDHSVANVMKVNLNSNDFAALTYSFGI